MNYLLILLGLILVSCEKDDNAPEYPIEEKELNDVLKDMGLTLAFNPDQADFSNIIEDMQLYISKVKHKTFIEVNEKGTEAAAVTSVEIVVTSIEPSSQFIADRPFLFVIREKYTNSILFMGWVEDPSKE